MGKKIVSALPPYTIMVGQCALQLEGFTGVLQGMHRSCRPCLTEAAHRQRLRDQENWQRRSTAMPARHGKTVALRAYIRYQEVTQAYQPIKVKRGTAGYCHDLETQLLRLQV